jgi:hypothetical protein
MRKRFGRLSLTVTAALALLLAVGAVAASAHGGPGGGGGRGGGGASVSSLVTQAAKELNVARTKLVTAIQDAAAARIDAAATDGDITSDQADDLKAEAQDNLSIAYSVSATATVASKLGITTDALNTGFKNARKALATARIDKALAAGDISADDAAQMKDDLAKATLPGYRSGGLGGPGGGFGGPGGGFGGRGFGGHH